MLTALLPSFPLVLSHFFFFFFLFFHDRAHDNDDDDDDDDREARDTSGRTRASSSLTRVVRW